jgi:predicted kinase
MAKCYQLIGVPCAGKSTWIKNQNWVKDFVVVSTDEFVEDYAKEVGSTYNDVFDDYMPTAVKLMADKVVRAREAGKDIIWDQTSVSIKSRKRKFNMLPDYEHIAVVFPTPDEHELSRRLDSRPGKTIPDFVMRSMVENFDVPTLDEGFSEIRVVKSTTFFG